MIINEANPLQIPAIGDNILRVLTGTVLELMLVDSVPTNASRPVWDWVVYNSSGTGGTVFSQPTLSKITVTVNGTPATISGCTFKRQPFWAPLKSDQSTRDFRMYASLFLVMSSAITDGALVVATNPDQTLWANTLVFSTTKRTTRFNPAIHVATGGYQYGVNAFNGANWPKRAVVSYYLGNSATPGAINSEMDLSNSTTFQLIRESDGTAVHSGSLNADPDTNNTYTPMQYQRVKSADFTAYNPASADMYHLLIPDMGVSYSFPITDGCFMAHARTYALGIYNQRCGVAVSKPYSRHEHVACHLQPVIIPDDTHGNWGSSNGGIAANTSPSATSKATCFYPSIKTGTISAYGANHDAGDYGLYTFDVADLGHKLVNAVDSLNLGTFDNLGIPESGDTFSDLLAEAKLSADYLLAMQDSDGGIWALQRPVNRDFEQGVGLQSSGDAGDQRQVWPKNLYSTATAAGFLAEIGSSPLFIAQYGTTIAASYVAAAVAGYNFIQTGISHYGSLTAAFQKVYTSNFTNDLDGLAYCAASLYAATGTQSYATQLFSWFPDPTSTATYQSGVRKMSFFYGAAMRVYCFMEASGKRASGSQTFNGTATTWNTAAIAQITGAGADRVAEINSGPWRNELESNNKNTYYGGYQFAMQFAYDIAYAYAKAPAQNLLDAFANNLSYMTGVNPNNLSIVTGLGIKRFCNPVNQYHLVDKRVLSPTGQIIGNPTTQIDDHLLNGGGYGLADNFSVIAELVFPPYRNPVNSGTGVSNRFAQMEKTCDTWNYGGDEWVTSQVGAPALVASLWIAKQTAAATRPWKPT